MNQEEQTRDFMQVLASALDETLQEVTGEKMGFVLIVAGLEDQLKTNFISNVCREHGVGMLKATAERLEGNA